MGGRGTRLMPLTQNMPKPMLPVAGLPVTEHQLVMAKRAGITSIVLATSYFAETFIPYFGDGSHWGIDLQYAVEEEPLGTGGAIRNAAQLLRKNESIAIFNGDVLTSHNLKGQIEMHERLDADVTLYLTHVADARAFGCVPLDEEGRVTAFLEKMEKPVTNTINAGCYIFNPRVIDRIPSGQVVSIEREVFPELVRDGLGVYGMVDDSYWLDLGTPAALLQGSVDLVRGVADASALDGIPTEHRSQDYVSLEGACVEEGAIVTGGSAIGSGAIVGTGALIDASIICQGANIQPGARVFNSFVEVGATVVGDLILRDSYISQDDVVTALPL